jgi:hypothetical protein
MDDGVCAADVVSTASPTDSTLKQDQCEFDQSACVGRDDGSDALCLQEGTPAEGINCSLFCLLGIEFLKLILLGFCVCCRA